jgi:hypothetical protein
MREPASQQQQQLPQRQGGKALQAGAPTVHLKT